LRLVSDRGGFGKSKLNMLSREKRNLPLTRDFIFVDRFRSLSRLLDSRAILILTYSVERAGRRAGGNATTTFRPSSLFYSTRPAPGLLLSCRASCSVLFLPPRSCRKPSPVSASLTALQRRPPPYVLNPLRSPPSSPALQARESPILVLLGDSTGSHRFDVGIVRLDVSSWWK
jgi:hypothetical protein